MERMHRNTWGRVATVWLGLTVAIAAGAPASADPAEEAEAIARRVTPSVVTITTRQVVEEQVQRVPGFVHPFMDPRFRDRFGEPREREYGGLGSGIVISEDGYVLTNHHVAGGADEIKVILSDNREFDATLVGADSLTDVAVIKVEAPGLKPIVVGNSDHVQIGEWVLAIGAPMGMRFRSTVTSGIVSAVGRDLDIIRDRENYAIEDFIQTDAAINKGNSGGALVNLRGELIGVNTAIASATGGFVGYGFAIPVNLAKKIMDDIVEYGRVRRGYLGISMSAVTAAQADAFGLDRPRGVLVAQVIAGSPAESAGLQQGDIVLEVDGQEVNRGNHIQNLIARKRPGDPVSLQVRRGSKTLELDPELGEKQGDLTELASVRRVDSGDADSSPLGLSVRNLTPDVAARFGLEEGTEGVVVTRVHRGPARRAGFQRGDVIFRVRQRALELRIRSVEDFRAAMDRLRGGVHAAFSVVKAGRPVFVTVRVPE